MPCVLSIFYLIFMEETLEVAVLFQEKERERRLLPPNQARDAPMPAPDMPGTSTRHTNRRNRPYKRQKGTVQTIKRDRANYKHFTCKVWTLYVRSVNTWREKYEAPPHKPQKENVQTKERERANYKKRTCERKKESVRNVHTC